MQETQETRVLSLGREDSLEKEMATRSSTLAWKTPWTEEPGRLQSPGSQSGTQPSTSTQGALYSHAWNSLEETESNWCLKDLLSILLFNFILMIVSLLFGGNICLFILNNFTSQDFPGGPVVKSPSCTAGGVGWIPGSGNLDPTHLKAIKLVPQLLSPCIPEPAHHN